MNHKSRNMGKVIFSIFGFIAVITLNACNPKVPIAITVKAVNEKVTIDTPSVVDDEIMKRLDNDTNMLCYLTDPNSGMVVGELNISEPGEMINMGSATQTITDLLSYTDQCNGVYDPTTQILWDTYDFALGGRYVSDEELADALRWVDYKSIEIDGTDILRKNENARFGFGPVIDSAIVDTASEILESEGIGKYLVRCGQFIAFGSEKPGDSYTYEFRYPLDPVIEEEKGLKVGSVRILDGEYLAALDDDEKFFFEHGEQYHMVINPSTGKPAREVRAAVVVSENSCLQAGVFAYAVMVMGIDRGLEFLDKTEGVSGLLMDSDHKVHVSGGLSERFWR